VNEKITILGVETSCDDTGIAVLNLRPCEDNPKKINLTVLSNKLASQTDIHNEYGGVVPELASREHLRALLPLTEEAIRESKIDLPNLSHIAVTAGPGLKGSLLTGLNFSSGLAAALNIPVIPVNHLEGHVMAAFIDTQLGFEPTKAFPFLTLLISGGHTQIILAEEFGRYTLLGETLDDAVGEAFDKTSKLLGLGYPGGPEIERIAKAGNPRKFNFPKPLTDKKNLNFSFSGLKTAVSREIEKNRQGNNEWQSDISASLQDTIANILCIKMKLAIELTNVKKVVVSGGVAANHQIRKSLSELCKSQNAVLIVPKPEICADNGLMIAWVGGLKAHYDYPFDEVIKVLPRWNLTDLHC
jgi:N6-L-threonylcarbamoyladenine synthase